MPPKPKMSKASADRPERGARKPPAGPKPQTSPVLIIFLVFFILLSLVLGVFLYIDKDKVDAAQKNADEQRRIADTAVRNQKLEQEYFQVVLRSWLGDPSITEQEIDYVRQQNNLFAGQSIDPRNDEAHKYFSTLQNLMLGGGAQQGLIGPVDPNTGKPRTDLRRRIEELVKERDLLAKNYREKEGALAKLNKDYTDYKAQFNEQTVREARAAVQRDYEAQLKDKLATKDAAIKDLNDKIAAVTREVELLLADNRKNFDEDKKRLEDKVRAALDDLGSQRQQVKQLLTNRAKIDFDKERGKVIRVDPTGETLFVDIGSESNLQPGTTFSIYRRGPGGKPGAEPLATIEIISVQGPNLSMARVTKVAKPAFARPTIDPETKTPTDPTSNAFWITDPKQFFHSRNPLLEGDLLFNPLWDPKERVHVFLAGVFDLDGDGNDDFEAFRRLLTERGTIIDGYLDPAADYAMRGKLDYQTDYLIVGSGPVITAEGVAAGNVPIGVGKAEEASRALQLEAQKKGVAIVKLKEFLARMGFSNLRVPSNPNAGGVLNGRPAGAAEKPAEGQ